MATSYNMSFYKGETWKIRVILHDASRAALNLTSGVVEFRLSDETGQRDIMTLSTDDDTIEVVNASSGTCDIQVNANAQANIVSNASYRYEVRATDSDGVVGVQIIGKIAVKNSLFE